MNKDNYFTNLLQNLGFLAAISVAFFQFTLNDSFKFIFNANGELFESATLVVLILSITIILGLFANRYFILNKIYFNQNKKNKYLHDLNEQNRLVNNPNVKVSKKLQKIVQEPWNFTLLQLAFFLIFLSLISFILLLTFNSILILTILCYVLFICSAVAAISIFSIHLYNDNEYKNKQQGIDSIILGKIRERFVENVKIIFDSTDTSIWNPNIPNRTIIFEYNSEKYRIFTRSDNPNNYFNLHKFDPTDPQRSEF